MFDILVYLFENYIHATACPESEQLARKLSAAGFEQDEISEALDWLAGLRRHAGTPPLLASPSAGAMRIYSSEEQVRLDAECRGFLTFLENAGAIEAGTREIIIERTLALDGFTVSLKRLKVIVLMVLWQRELLDDGLIIDELLGIDADDGELLPH